MKRLYLLIIIYCVHIHSYAQEYQITEVEEIAYSFFNASQQYAPGINGNHPKKQISSIAAISRDSTNYMYLANTTSAEDRRVDALSYPARANYSRIMSRS